MTDQEFTRTVEHGFTVWRENDGTVFAIAVDPENGTRRALTPEEKQQAVALGIIKQA